MDPVLHSAIIDNDADAIVLSNAAGNILYVNPAA